MTANYRDKSRTLTPEKTVAILARHGTIISVEKAKILLEFLYKFSNLSVSQAIKRANQAQTKQPAKLKNRDKKQEL